MVGLILAMVGISEVRSTFTEQPGWPVRAWRWVTGRLTGRRWPGVTRSVGLAGEVHMASQVVAKVGTAWGNLTPGEQMKRMQSWLDRHEELLVDLQVKIRDEENARKAADQEEARRREEMRRELLDQVREAAAGGLRRETLGVVLFFIGVLLQTIGAGLG